MIVWQGRQRWCVHCKFRLQLTLRLLNMPYITFKPGPLKEHHFHMLAEVFEMFLSYYAQVWNKIEYHTVARNCCHSFSERSKKKKKTENNRYQPTRDSMEFKLVPMVHLMFTYNSYQTESHQCCWTACYAISLITFFAHLVYPG